MSLYYEASTLIETNDPKAGSLKSRVFGSKKLKSPPAALFALVTEATKWSNVLTEVIDKSALLTLEKKLTPALALLLVHDLLLSKKGIAAPNQHALTLAVAKHKARLTAELTKCRLRNGFATIDDFRAQINSDPGLGQETSGDGALIPVALHPRWIRINTIKTNLQTALSTTFSSFTVVTSLQALYSSKNTIFVDSHIPNLVAVPPTTDLSKSPAYLKGEIIFQDKASCFPAYLLDPKPTNKHVVDTCAAPGNKTTHLAAILHSHSSKNATNGSKDSRRKARITACERDKTRATTLTKMLRLAGADDVVSVRAGQDFLRLKPDGPEHADVGALLLDPSCSGSGIVGRDEGGVQTKLYLPSLLGSAATISTTTTHKSKKRKRGSTSANSAQPPTSAATPTNEETPEIAAETDLAEEEADKTLEEDDEAKMTKRLTALSAFQLLLLTHAMAFPAATRLTYSTCSVHSIENESVVLRALTSSIAKTRGWRVLRRQDQVSGIRDWEKRGDQGSVEAWIAERETQKVDEEGERLDVKEVSQACVRCEKGTQEGTMGFFVCGFVRDGDASDKAREIGGDGAITADEEDEWNGFSGGEV